MADPVTNTVILQHMQIMKSDLQGQMHEMKNDLQSQISSLDKKVTNLEITMQKGFAEVRLDIRALQEDLEVTMLTVARHDKKLARL
jgi:hypothetical protein